MIPLAAEERNRLRKMRSLGSQLLYKFLHKMVAKNKSEHDEKEGDLSRNFRRDWHDGAQKAKQWHPFRRMYFPSLHHLPALSVEKPLSLLVSFSSLLSFIFAGWEPVTIFSKFHFPDENTDH